MEFTQEELHKAWFILLNERLEFLIREQSDFETLEKLDTNTLKHSWTNSDSLLYQYVGENAKQNYPYLYFLLYEIRKARLNRLMHLFRMISTRHKEIKIQKIRQDAKSIGYATVKKAMIKSGRRQSSRPLPINPEVISKIAELKGLDLVSLLAEKHQTKVKALQRA